MTRWLTLALWAIPYAARWTLSKVGIVVTIPASGNAATVPEELFQQFLAISALAGALAAMTDPTVGLAVWAPLAVVKLYNASRITLDN